jgi:hypothetical protein
MTDAITFIERFYVVWAGLSCCIPGIVPGGVIDRFVHTRELSRERRRELA